MLPVKDVKKNIEHFFKTKLHDIQQTYCFKDESDRIYLEAMYARLLLERFGFLSKEVEKLFSDITLYKIGVTTDEVHKLTSRLSHINIQKLHNIVPDDLLTEDEMDKVTHYHQFLFSDMKKNVDPFNKDFFMSTED